MIVGSSCTARREGANDSADPINRSTSRIADLQPPVSGSTGCIREDVIAVLMPHRGNGSGSGGSGSGGSGSGGSGSSGSGNSSGKRETLVAIYSNRCRR